LVTAYHVARACLFDLVDPDDPCFDKVEFVGTRRIGGKLYLDNGIDKSSARVRYRDMRRWPDNRPGNTDRQIRLKKQTAFGNSNEIPTDKYICYMPPQFWTKVGLKAMSMHRPVVGECISVTGYVAKQGRVMTARGAVRSVDSEEMTYVASTLPGWSGTPVSNRGAVYAVHSNARSAGPGSCNVGKLIGNLSPYILDRSESDIDYMVERGTIMMGGKEISLETEDYYLSGTKERAVYGIFADSTRVYLNDIDALASECAEKWGVDETEALDILEEYASGRMSRKRLNRHTSNRMENSTGLIVPEVPKTRRKRRKSIGKSSNPDVKSKIDGLPFSKVSQLSSLPVRPVENRNNLTEQQLERARALGYDEKAFSQPVLTVKTEETSFLNAYHKIQESKYKFHKQVVPTVLKMLKQYRFVPLSLEQMKDTKRLQRLLDTRVKGDSSPGRWYKTQGYSNNADLLRARPDFVKEVVENWDNSRELRYFNKDEPHKIIKIREGKLRGIYSFSLDKLVQDNSIFEPLLNQLEKPENFMATPLLFSWSHQAGGNAALLANNLKFDPNNQVVVSSDKKAHDTYVTGTSVEIIIKIIEGLAVHSDTELLAQWRKEARKSLDSAFGLSQIALSNGDVYRQNVKGFVKSGYLLTWFVNSLNQLIDHVEVLLRMGVPASEIVPNRKYKMLSFGDDAANVFPKTFPFQDYREKVNSITPIGDWQVHSESLDGFEFCSNVLVKVPGGWGMKPVRFTKHVMNYNVMDPKSRIQAVMSYLREYCYDEPRFNFWLSLFIDLEGDVSQVEDIQTYRNMREGLEIN